MRSTIPPEKCSHLLFAVEEGSAGQEVAAEKGFRCMTYSTQTEALKSVLDKQCDAAIVDKIIASTQTAKGEAYEGLAYDFPLSEEDICVGLRKGSSLEEKIEAFFTVYNAGGDIARLAKHYNMIDAMFR